MKKSKRSGRGTKADDDQNHTSGITRRNLGHGANKITRGAIASTGVRGDSAAPTSNPRTLQMQPTAVVPMDTDRANGNLSQREKSDPGAIAKYVDAISGNWRRGVEAFLEIARLCAEAEERLDTAQQAELKAKLPFGATTFSKFRQIGLDARLRKPEVQLLLPAAYTTIYAITTRRVFLRIGIALPLTINLPLRRIEASSLALHADGEALRRAPQRLEPGTAVGHRHLRGRGRRRRTRVRCRGRSRFQSADRRCRGR